MKSIPYANLMGSSMYAMISCRPDLGYSMSTISKFMSNPGKPHWEAANGFLDMLKDLF